MLRAYEGDDDYIFVSYAHADRDIVIPVISALQSAGFRVWYDAGIEAGSEWNAYIANHVNACRCLLAFLSSSSVASKYCRREMHFAFTKDKDMLFVYLEDLELPLEMEMDYGLSQALYRNNFGSDDLFISELLNARILGPCRSDEDVRPMVAAQDTSPQTDHVQTTPQTHDKDSSEQPKPKKSSGAGNTGIGRLRTAKRIVPIAITLAVLIAAITASSLPSCQVGEDNQKTSETVAQERTDEDASSESNDVFPSHWEGSCSAILPTIDEAGEVNSATRMVWFDLTESNGEISGTCSVGADDGGSTVDGTFSVTGSVNITMRTIELEGTEWIVQGDLSEMFSFRGTVNLEKRTMIGTYTRMSTGKTGNWSAEAT